MDLESVMCELAGTSNTSIVPLLSLEKEQFMCQVSHFCNQGQGQRHNEERQNTKSQTALRGRTSRVRSVVKRDLGSPGRSRARCTSPHVQCDILNSTVTGKVHHRPPMCNATSRRARGAPGREPACQGAEKNFALSLQACCTARWSSSPSQNRIEKLEISLALYLEQCIFSAPEEGLKYNDNDKYTN